MIKIYKKDIEKSVQDDKVEAYLAAGWTKKKMDPDVVILKPAAVAKAAVVATEPGNNDINQGE